MKIGCCVPRARLAAARAAGFDYGELAVVESLMPLDPDSAWEPIAREIEAAGLPVEATNVFFPGSWRLTGPHVDREATRAYVETAVRRASSLGVAVMVLGSGGARNCPEGWPMEQARSQFAEVLQMAAEAGARYGVTVALEPLRRQESNLINTVAEGLALVAPLRHPHLGVLADFYHMDEEQEPLDDLLRAGALLQHVHLADTGRRAPGTGGYDYPGFLSRLRQIRYAGRVSIECTWGEDWEAEARAAVAFLRGLNVRWT